MRDLAIVEWNSGNWLAVYVDGSLFFEGHDMDTGYWIKLITSYKISSVSIFDYTFDSRDEASWTRAPGMFISDFREGELKLAKQSWIG